MGNIFGSCVQKADANNESAAVDNKDAAEKVEESPATVIDAGSADQAATETAPADGVANDAVMVELADAEAPKDEAAANEAAPADSNAEANPSGDAATTDDGGAATLEPSGGADGNSD